MSTAEQPRPTDDPTIGRLVAEASRDISALLHSEIALAKSEIKFSAKAGGIGAAMFVVAGFFGLLITVMLSIAAGYFLVMAGLDPAWAFLIVAGAYLLLALFLILIGVVMVKKVKAPQKTISTAKEIPAALKGDTTPHAIRN
ncbi:MAG: phage holin family protein [Aeromicrobium sp.]